MIRKVIEDMDPREAREEAERCSRALSDPRTRPDEKEGWRVDLDRCHHRLRQLGW
jgi:hypothetical protein